MDVQYYYTLHSCFRSAFFSSSHLGQCHVMSFNITRSFSVVRRPSSGHDSFSSHHVQNLVIGGGGGAVDVVGGGRWVN